MSAPPGLLKLIAKRDGKLAVLWRQYSTLDALPLVAMSLASMDWSVGDIGEARLVEGAEPLRLVILFILCEPDAEPCQQPERDEQDDGQDEGKGGFQMGVGK